MKQEQTYKKIYFVTGGGTGGHIYPALAVAKILDNEENSKVYYIGNPKKPEANLSKQNELDFLGINVSYMPRKISFTIIFWLTELFFAVIKSIFYILKYKPSGIYATGGYVSAPMIFAAIFMKVPFMMHDGDAIPGIVTRKLSPFAKVVSCSFNDAKKYINNNNIHLTGNPIRKDFSTITKNEARKILNLDSKKLTLLIIGGSQGAKSINFTIIELYKTLIEKYNIAIIHQTGAKNYEESIEKLENIYPEYKNNSSIIIKPYFDNAAIVMKASDIAIARAGSLSLSELFASELPSILIPYPHAAANHQLKNALAAQNEHAAFCIEESEKLKEDILPALTELIENENTRTVMKSNAQRLSRPDAAQETVKLFKGICHE